MEGGDNIDYGDLAPTGHTYFGTINTVQDAQAILEASKQGLLPRVTRRLTDAERMKFVKAGACFCWEEEEAGIRRWTDHVKWSPSRVSGAFLTYTEVPPRGDDTLIKQSFSLIDSQTNCKMHLIAYSSKAAQASGELPTPSQDPAVQRFFSAGGLRRRSSPLQTPVNAPSPSSTSSSSATSTNSPGIAAEVSLPSQFGRHPSFSSKALSHRRSSSNIVPVASGTMSDGASPRNSITDSIYSRSEGSSAVALAKSPSSGSHASGSDRGSTSGTGTNAWPFAFTIPGSAPSSSSSSISRSSYREKPPNRSEHLNRTAPPLSLRGEPSPPPLAAVSGYFSLRPTHSSSSSVSSVPNIHTSDRAHSLSPTSGASPHSAGKMSRQLVPHELLASGLTLGDSPPHSSYSPLHGTFVDHDDDEDDDRQSDGTDEKQRKNKVVKDRGRGYEDERQLRLLSGPN